MTLLSMSSRSSEDGVSPWCLEGHEFDSYQDSDVFSLFCMLVSYCSVHFSHFITIFIQLTVHVPCYVYCPYKSTSGEKFIHGDR